MLAVKSDTSPYSDAQKSSKSTAFITHATATATAAAAGTAATAAAAVNFQRRKGAGEVRQRSATNERKGEQKGRKQWREKRSQPGVNR